MKNFLLRHRKLHLWLLGDLVFLAAFLAARESRSAMNALTHGFTDPLRRAVGRVCERVPFSIAESLYALAALALVCWLAYGIRAVVRRRGRGRAAAAYTCIMGIGAAIATIYALFCLLWGANYYADSFSDQSGLAAEPVALDDLYRVTVRFAERVNDASAHVARNADGTYSGDRAAILAYGTEVYDALYTEFPFLEAEDVAPKAMFFSRIMSAMGFTGFYFPFTGESNVNVDFPAATLPSTVAHELAHRRGIASEQECNFLSVLACERCDDADYNYAGALSGYIYLSNALYAADPTLWRAVYDTLDDGVRADLRAANAYWAQFEGPIDTVSNAVYDGFLKSYGTIGVKSYGACVDLLVAYYRPTLP